MKRPYRHIHLACNDPDARRAYDREQQRKWRAKNSAGKKRPFFEKTQPADRDSAGWAAARGSQSVADLWKHFTTELTNRSRRVP